MKAIRKQFNSVVKDLGDGIMEAIISSKALDRHGEILDIDGLSTKEYMKNPVVAAFHNYNEPPVAKTISLKKVDGKLIARFKWAKDVYDKAKVLHDLYKEGFQQAFSIGFIPLEQDGNRYTKSTMIEFSAVLIPANPEALLLAKAKGLDIDKLNIEKAMNLNEILAKNLEEFTLAEVKFVNEHKSELTAEQLKSVESIIEKTEEPVDMIAQLSEVMDNKLKELREELDPVVKKKEVSPSVKSVPMNVSKEEKFKSYVKGLYTNDMSEYKSIMKAMNTEDDSVLLPPAEFTAEVERLEEDYGVARKYAQVRRSTTGKGITMLFGDDDVETFDTEEMGVKTSTRMSFTQELLTWRKRTAILPIADEMLEDSALNLWNEATQRFARAYAKAEDEMVFTRELGAGNLYAGVLEETGVNEVFTGGTVSNLTFENLIDAVYGVPTPSMRGGRWFLNRQILPVLAKIKDDNDQYVWSKSVAEGVPGTIWGHPYEIVEVLPGIDADGGFIVFGDLKYTTLGYRTDMQMKLFDAGSVGDPDSEDEINLLTQDAQALRVVRRMNARIRFPSAFSVIKTGSAGS